MNKHVLHYFQAAAQGGRFWHVLALHQEQLPFEQASHLAPDLPRGWYELAGLDKEARIEFVRGFWEATLPYIPHVDASISRFFSRLDEVGIFLTQDKEDGPYRPQMALSLVEGMGFFHGGPPASQNKRAQLRAQFVKQALPADYLAFLRIHDGFGKVTDTGIYPAQDLGKCAKNFDSCCKDRDPLPHWLHAEQEVDPNDLIPFYQSFGMDSFQCFYADWYPEQEMGNLYYSGIDHTLSDYTNHNRLVENLAFPTFLDWLAFYLDSVTD